MMRFYHIIIVLVVLSSVLCIAEEESASCSLYLVETTSDTSDEGRRWGLYAGGFSFSKNQSVFVEDNAVAIPLVDYEYQMDLQRGLMVSLQPPSAKWLTDSITNTKTTVHFEAEQAHLLHPGLAMMLQLQNTDVQAYRRSLDVSRSDPHAGSASPYSFTKEWLAQVDVPAWSSIVNTHPTNPVAAATATVTAEGIVDTNSDGFSSNEYDHEELLERGWCMDRATLVGASTEGSSSATTAGGVLASRDLVQGEMVLPVPVVPLHRKHLQMLAVDDDKSILWEGNQLMLNYCLGNPASSVLLFPHGPIFHSIQYSTDSNNKVNVGLRWSMHMPKPQLMNLSTEELMQQHGDVFGGNGQDSLEPGLVLEVYALYDIKIGERLVLHRGEFWQRAWEDHVRQWRKPPVHGDEYQPAAVWDALQEIDGDELPSYVDVRCWVSNDVLRDAVLDDGWYEWRETNIDTSLDATVPCRIDSVDPGGKYRVIVESSTAEGKIRNLPRKALTIIDKPYTGNLFLRKAFRHESDLPIAMLPQGWRDLEPNNENQRCGLYAAESGIPNAGLGMYTTKPIMQGERISSGDVVIQIDDYLVHQRLRRWYNNNIEDFEEDISNIGVVSNYLWHGFNSLGHMEAEAVWSVIPGVGSLSNSHLGLVNSMIRIPVQTTELHRSTDPGAGAATTFHDCVFIATQDIGRGEEIFVTYGENWFLTRPELGPIPLTDDHKNADRLLEQFFSLINESVSSDLSRDLFQLLHVISPPNSRFTSALPKTVNGVEQAVKTGTARYGVPDTIKSIEWLEENGVCLDNLRPGRSTIPQAGKGAFATRTIKKGDVIAPVPLVHIFRSSLERYESDDQNDPKEEVRQIGKSLLLNYAFGHPESSMLFFTYSPIVNYVNHNATTFNAKLRWSSKLPTHNTSWFHRTPEDLVANEEHVGLVMEIVATRDIKAGEEVFLDYNGGGSAWDEAWRAYEQNWRPDPDAKDYVSAAELNRDIQWVNLREPYDAEAVTTVCFTEDLGKAVEADSPGVFRWTFREDIYDSTDYVQDCTIIRRDETIDMDLAYDRKDSVRPIDVRYDALVTVGGRQVVFKGVPRHAIRFLDEPYSSDTFLPNAFRHEAYLPDEMVPEAWRDLATQ